VTVGACLLATALIGVDAVEAGGSASRLTANRRAAARMVEDLDAVRVRYGEPRLRRSRALGRRSSRFARWLMVHDEFHHAARMSGTRFSRVGEVLAIHFSYGPRVEPTVGEWLRSTVHREVLLNPGFRWVGAGISRGHFGRARATIWVVRFGRR
jgi:hypothetical protein